LIPAECWMTNVSSDSSGSPASSSGTRSAIDLFFGFRLSRTPTSPNWNEPSTRTTDLPSSAPAAIARLTATVQARPGSDRGDHHPAQLLLLARVDLPDRGGQLVAAEGLDQELARAGEHRPAEVVRFALDRHHHDRRGRDLGRQLLRGRDAVHVRHVDVHQDDVGPQLARHRDGFRAGRGRSHHLDVALEAEELGQVVAGLRDVVHDEDADLVGHSSVGPVGLTAGGGWGRGPGALDGRGTGGPTRPSRWLGDGRLDGRFDGRSASRPGGSGGRPRRARGSEPRSPW
jgi:hypothetical protein